MVCFHPISSETATTKLSRLPVKEPCKEEKSTWDMRLCVEEGEVVPGLGRMQWAMMLFNTVPLGKEIMSTPFWAKRGLLLLESR